MAKIVINDLAESVDLDQQALASIYGGASASVQKPDPIATLIGKGKLNLLELARTKRLLRR
ncbi:MAG: hypothetical protein HKN19_06220 [Halioglobus sp.]|nr:hypothetical protein [Halioglobus sp.]